jgi:hypothetical protein
MNENDPIYLTYRQWIDATVNKTVELGLKLTSKEDQDGWFRVQIEAAIRQACRHGRSGRSDDDPVQP